MNHIVKGSHTRQMDLCSLPRLRPILTPLLNPPLHILVHLPIHLHNLYSLPLRPMYLPSHSLIIRRRINLNRIQPLFRRRNDRRPSQLMCQIMLRLFINATPNRLE